MTRGHCNPPVLTDGFISCKNIVLVLYNDLENLFSELRIPIAVYFSVPPALVSIIIQFEICFDLSLNIFCCSSRSPDSVKKIIKFISMEGCIYFFIHGVCTMSVTTLYINIRQKHQCFSMLKKPGHFLLIEITPGL